MTLALSKFPERVATLALAWLSIDSRARLMVSSDGRILWSNARAEAIFSPKVGVMRRDELLHFASPEHERRFLHFACTAAEGETLALRRADGAGWILCRGHRLEIDGEVVGCVEISLDDPRFAPRYHDLQTIFALTPAEHRVVLHLLDGHRVDTIGKMLNISIGTVRTHVRRIYQKLSVGSREELLSVLRPYSIS